MSGGRELAVSAGRAFTCWTLWPARPGSKVDHWYLESSGHGEVVCILRPSVYSGENVSVPLETAMDTIGRNLRFSLRQIRMHPGLSVTIMMYYERAQHDLASIPGVQDVAFTYNPPLSRLDAVPPPVRIEGQSPTESLRNSYVNLQMVSENYFEFMRIPLKAGRFFNRFDREETESVTIISERPAKLLWPGQNPIGKRLQYNPARIPPYPYYTVVGVAGNVQHRELGGEPSLEMYLFYRQHCDSNEYMLVKTSLSPREFEQRAQQVMWAIDSEQSVFNFRSYDQRILDTIWHVRLSRMLLTVFAAVALVLSAIGVYGVMSFLVGQRAREIGIRLAMGATPTAVRTLIVRRGTILALIGAIAGLCAAAALGRVIQHYLNYVNGDDPFMLVAAVGALVG